MYEPEIPMYHLKQNSRQILYHPDLNSEGKLILTFRKLDHCYIRILRSGEPLADGAIILRKADTHQIEVTVDHDLLEDSWITMQVPDNCVLYLTKAERIFSLGANDATQVRYSHRNNKPAELRDLASTGLYNVARYRFVTLASQLKFGTLESYNDTHAEFIWRPESIMVIPQNSAFTCYITTPLMRFREQDVVVMTMERLGGPDCQTRLPNAPDASFKEIDARRFELSFERHLLQQAGLDFVLQTWPNCELKVIRVSRTIALQSDPALQQQFRHGMTPDRMKRTRLGLGVDNVRSPVTRFNFIEALDGLPLLHFERDDFFYRVFRKSVAGFKYKVPKDFYFLLHTVVDPSRTRRDVVGLTFNDPSGKCRIKFYQSRNGQRQRVFDTSRGVLIQPLKSRLKVVFRRNVLNANYPTGTKVLLRSSCHLKVLELSRRVKTGPTTAIEITE